MRAWARFDVEVLHLLRSAAASCGGTDGRRFWAIPAAIRPGLDLNEPISKYDAPFWVGVGMGALGLVLIVYAAIQIYASYA